MPLVGREISLAGAPERGAPSSKLQNPLHNFKFLKEDQMTQKVVPFETVALPEGKKPGWQPMVDEKGMLLGFANPKFGLIRHSAIVDEKEGKLNFLYDGLLWEDGPIDPETQQASPNAVIVPIEEREDGYYVHCHREFRPVIRDHIAGVWGVEVLSIAGGFTKKGAKPSETALSELLDEEGIQVEEGTMERIGWGSPNRAFVATCLEIWIAKFKLKGEAKPDTAESIHGNEVVRIDKFPFGVDLIVNAAVFAAAAHLGCVSPKPEKKGLIALLRNFLEQLLSED